MTDGLGGKDKWFSEIMNFSINRPVNDIVKINQVVNVYGELDSLTIDQQFDVISACPNIHSWASKKNRGVKMHQYFNPNGVSPRNIILDAIELARNSEEHLKLITKTLQLVLGKAYKIKTIPKATREKVFMIIWFV